MGMGTSPLLYYSMEWAKFVGEYKKFEDFAACMESSSI